MSQPQSPLIDALVTRQMAARRQAILGCGVPIVDLPESDQFSAGRLGGWESFDDVVTNVSICHGSQSDGPEVIVSTSRWADTRIGSGPLRWLVEHQMRRQGHRFSDEDWTEDDITITVDGLPVSGRIVRAGSRWWAARCQQGDIEISIAAFAWNPASIMVDTVADLDMLLSNSDRETYSTMPSGQGVTVTAVAPGALTRNPLRALVDVDLEQSREHADWLADGGPCPAFPPHRSALWQEAVRWYITLTGQSESAAERGVAVIVDQVCNLYHNAAWFRENSELRERAVSETLMFGTGLDENVSSRRAQQAWYRKNEMQIPVNSVEIDSYAAVSRGWIEEWSAWAGQPPEQASSR